MLMSKHLSQFTVGIFVAALSMALISCGGGGGSSSSTTTSSSSDLSITGTVEVPSASSGSYSSYLTASANSIYATAVSDVAATDAVCTAFTAEGQVIGGTDVTPIAISSDGSFTIPALHEELRPTALSDTSIAYSSDIIIEVTVNPDAEEPLVLTKIVNPDIDPASTTTVNAGITNADTHFATEQLKIELFGDTEVIWGSGDYASLVPAGKTIKETAKTISQLVAVGDPASTNSTKEIGLLRDTFKGFIAGGGKASDLSCGTQADCMKAYLKGTLPDIDFEAMKAIATVAAPDLSGTFGTYTYGALATTFTGYANSFVNSFVGNETFRTMNDEELLATFQTACSYQYSEYKSTYIDDTTGDMIGHLMGYALEVDDAYGDTAWDPYALKTGMDKIHAEWKSDPSFAPTSDYMFTFVGTAQTIQDQGIDCSTNYTECSAKMNGIFDTIMINGTSAVLSPDGTLNTDTLDNFYISFTQKYDAGGYNTTTGTFTNVDYANDFAYAYNPTGTAPVTTTPTTAPVSTTPTTAPVSTTPTTAPVTTTPTTPPVTTTPTTAPVTQGTWGGGWKITSAAGSSCSIFLNQARAFSNGGSGNNYTQVPPTGVTLPAVDTFTAGSAAVTAFSLGGQTCTLTSSTGTGAAGSTYGGNCMNNTCSITYTKQ